MQNFFQTRKKSFANAFSGLAYVLRTQKNAWVHSLATAAVLILAIWLQLSILQWAFLVTMIGAVWAAECINTAIEAVVDLTCPQIHPLAKIAKDTAAAGVLMTAITAAVVGFLILGPDLLQKILGN